MKRWGRLLRGFLLAALCSSGFFLIVWWKIGAAGRLIPEDLRKAVPAGCRQLVLVQTAGVESVEAQVWLLQRMDEGSPWKNLRGPMPAVVGRHGAGWGKGEPALPNPGGYPEKQEGDGRSPAGIFRLPFAFGAGAAGAGAGPSGLPWLECTDSLRGVDDVKSKYYNLVVDQGAISDKDWNRAEIMHREDGAYDAGLMIGHNPDRVPGAGSCIFLHIWKGPGQGTAGCTAMAEENVRKILEWLKAGMDPRLVLAANH